MTTTMTQPYPPNNRSSMAGTGRAESTDRLSISNEFVGRDAEIERLQGIYRELRDEADPFEKRDQESSNSLREKNAKAIYVNGLSGTGKSRLVLEALQLIVEGDGGYFCQGKFDLNQSLRPFSALADALNDLCPKACKELREDVAARANIKKILEDNITKRAMVSIVPNVAHCLPVVEPKSESIKVKNQSEFSMNSSTLSTVEVEHQQLSGTLAVKLKILFRKLTTALMKDNRILVMFIDDLQWADIDSVDLIEDLVANLPFRRFLFVGGFRSDEVKEGHHFNNFLLEAEKATLPPSMISVQQLTLEDITLFVTATLKFNDTNQVAPLAELVHERTQGNIFFVRQYLDFLYQNGHVFYSQQTFQWEWEDLAIIQDVTAGEFSIGAVVSQKILKLPRDTIDALKLAACIGGRFDLEVIEYVAKQWWKAHGGADPASVDAIMMDDVLWSAVEEGLLEEVCIDPMSVTATLQYKFTHDNVQSASYTLIGIGGEAAEQYHLSVGQSLLTLYNASDDRNWLLVMAADHLYKSVDMVRSQQIRDEYADANLLAAVELESKAAFKSAAVYCQNAIVFLGKDCFDRNYDLSLKAYNMSAAMQSCAGCKSTSDARIDTILQRARCLDDKYAAYHVQIRSCYQNHNQKEGEIAAYALLRRMKVTRLPKKITSRHLIFEMARAFRAVKQLSADELMSKPTTADQTVTQYTMFLMEAFLCCFSNEPKIAGFLCFRAVQVSLKFGYSSYTPAFFVVFGYMRLQITGDLNESHRIGRIGMELSERFNAPQADGLTKFMYHAGLYWIASPLQDVPTLMKEVHDTSFSCGDSGWGAVGICYFVIASLLLSSARLDKVASMAAFYCDEMRTYDKCTFLDVTRTMRQVALNLLGRSKDPTRLEGNEITNWEAFQVTVTSKVQKTFVNVTIPMILCYHFYDWEKTEQLVTASTKMWKNDGSFFICVIVRVYHCLIWSCLYTRERKRKFKRHFQKAYTTLCSWHKAGSPNGAIFCVLIEALQKSTFGKHPPEEVRVAYEEAMVKTTKAGLTSFSMMAAERAGAHFALMEGQEELAKSFLQTAVQGYRDWGAMAKVHAIHERYSNLLGNYGKSED